MSVFLNHRITFFIFFISFSFRFFFALWQYKIGVVENFADDYHYYQFANEIAKQGFFLTDISMLKEHYAPPFLPWLLAIEIKMFGGSWLAIFIFNCFLASFSISIFYNVSLKYFSKFVSFLSSIWISIYPMYLIYTPTAGKDLLILIFNILLFFLFYEWSHKKDSLKLKIFFSLALSISFFVDERFLLFIPLYLLLFLYFSNLNFKNILGTIFLMVFICTLIHLPWVIRNYNTYGKIVIITLRTANLFDPIFGYENQKNVIDDSFKNAHLTEQEILEIYDGKRTTYNNGKKIRKRKIDHIKKGNFPKEFSFFENVFSNLKAFWKIFDLKDEYVEGGFKFDEKWSILHNISSVLFFGSILPFFLIKVFSDMKHITIISTAILIWATFIHSFIVPFTVTRYRTPYDFIIILNAFIYLEHIYLKKMKGKYNLIDKVFSIIS